MRLFYILIFTFSTMAFAEKSAKQSVDAKKSENEKKITLFDIEGDSTDKTSNLVLSFNKDLPDSDLKLEAHGSFVQLKLPNTFVPNSGEFIDLKSPYFTKAVVFQSGSQEGTLRVFVKGKAEDYLKASVADILGKKIIVTLDHQTLNSGEHIVALPPKAAISKKAETASIGGFDNKLQGKMTAVSIFCGVMLLGLLLLYYIRPYLRKRFKKHQLATGTAMETLAIHALSPKQKLALVQVGDEKILIGLSSDSISYIKTIGEKPVVQAAMAVAPAPIQQRSRSQMVSSARPKPQVKQNPRSVPAATKKVERESLNPAEKMLRAERENSESGVNIQLSKTRALTKTEDASGNSVEDIKKMIRQKLQQMPQIS